MKHAFADGRSGTLILKVKEHDSEIRLELQDDGPGFDPNIVRSTSIGQSLVQRLSRQIKATTQWDSDANGTRVSVIFPATSAATQAEK